MLAVCCVLALGRAGVYVRTRATKHEGVAAISSDFSFELERNLGLSGLYDAHKRLRLPRISVLSEFIPEIMTANFA